MIEGGPALLNQYGVIPVSPLHCPSANSADAMVFADWLVSDKGQAAIGSYTVNGQKLFVPNAETR